MPASAAVSRVGAAAGVGESGGRNKHVGAWPGTLDDGVHDELDPVPHQWHARPGDRIAGGVLPVGGPGVGGGDGNRVPPPPLVAVPAWRHHDEPVVQVPYRRVIGVAETLAQHVGQPAWVRQLTVRHTPRRGGRERTGRLRHVISLGLERLCLQHRTASAKLAASAVRRDLHSVQTCGATAAITAR